MTVKAQVALVSGADGPFGRAVAVGLAEAGLDVALASSSAGDASVFAMNSIANELWALGRRHLAVSIDPSRPGAAEEAVRRTLADLGRLDLLVTLPEPPRADTAAFAAVPEDELLELLQRRLGGVLLLSRAAGAVMLKRGGGVLNCVSAAALGGDGDPIAAATEAGVAGLTRSLADEWSGRVAVNGVSLRRQVEPPSLVSLILPLAAGDPRISGQVFDI